MSEKSQNQVKRSELLIISSMICCFPPFSLFIPGLGATLTELLKKTVGELSKALGMESGAKCSVRNKKIYKAMDKKWLTKFTLKFPIKERAQKTNFNFQINQTQIWLCNTIHTKSWTFVLIIVTTELL